MSKVMLDCRTLPCPQPVIQIKQLLEKTPPGELEVLVDNEPALENVSRFLASRGYTAASAEQVPGVWRISGARKDGTEEESMPLDAPAPYAPRPSAEDARTLVMIISPLFGSGDDELGAKLMKNFIATLPEMGESLWRLVLLNGGVTLAIDDSPVIDDLRRLEEAGVSILVCGTCLEHFEVLARKAVGQTTNMLDVVTSMQLADKVVRV